MKVYLLVALLGITQSTANPPISFFTAMYAIAKSLIEDTISSR
jgi:hypothetical protein